MNGMTFTDNNEIKSQSIMFILLATEQASQQLNEQFCTFARHSDSYGHIPMVNPIIHFFY